jgi:hypothetical protein
VLLLSRIAPALDRKNFYSLRVSQISLLSGVAEGFTGTNIIVFSRRGREHQMRGYSSYRLNACMLSEPLHVVMPKYLNPDKNPEANDQQGIHNFPRRQQLRSPKQFIILHIYPETQPRRFI